MLEKLKFKEIEPNKDFFLDWPHSNYLIFISLMLFAATATTLAIGDEKRAEELAIYAYYFLVIGVVIRFLELSLPDMTMQRLSVAKNRISRLQPCLHRTILEMTMSISDFIRKHPLNIVKPKKNIGLISQISWNIAIFLFVFFIISLTYGSMIDWGFVRGYLSNLVLFILGFLMLHILTRIR